eukprot:5070857-Lingulodinium_polyedra.AAC.1
MPQRPSLRNSGQSCRSCMPVTATGSHVYETRSASTSSSSRPAWPCLAEPPPALPLARALPLASASSFRMPPLAGADLLAPAPPPPCSL